MLQKKIKKILKRNFMKKYLVEKILKVDGIERFVLVKDTSDNKKLKMYFLSDMEDYVETFENMKDIKKEIY